MSIFGIDAFVIFCIGAGLGFVGRHFGPMVIDKVRGVEAVRASKTIRRLSAYCQDLENQLNKVRG